MTNIISANAHDTPSTEFKDDSIIIGKQTEEFLRLIYPSYLIDHNNLESLLDSQSTLQIDNMKYFRINRCRIENVDEIFEAVNEKIEKLFTALHSIGVSIGYGLVSRNGVTNLVLGIDSNDNIESVTKITQGMLSGIEMENYKPNFLNEDHSNMNYGILSGIPSLYLREQKQTFSLSSIMRSLNGYDYTILFLAKPVQEQNIAQNISQLISIKDQAFSVSKRNIARSNSASTTKNHTYNTSEGKSSNAGQISSVIGTGIGATVGSVIPFIGTTIGMIAGSALGTLIGSVAGGNKTKSKGYSYSISEAITNGETISGDIQNGFALELMNYTDKAIERFKNGYNSGMWQTTIVYSADSKASKNIIKACLYSELSKPDPDKLPLLAFEPKGPCNNTLYIPNFLKQEQYNPLCSYMTSNELGLLCTIPTEVVPDFELRIEKSYSLSRSNVTSDSIVIGNISEGKKELHNMPFGLSFLDLNKHTLICGITGSGKTTTVKKILKEAKKPFLVIESAKKEYRNLAVDTTVYTLGKPEINCPQINPFYIMQGISPQTHIDYLKDLFNASFSFYGPMSYILEKCLHNIYLNKGWDLTIGYHPMLYNSKSEIDFFDINYVNKKYKISSHKYLFPTMQDLKNEITRYIDDELKYEGEIAGNIKTAMKIRLENLCVGAKGFTFNTYDYLDFSELLETNIIFELEGLADDSDKAFCVGLLVIFINEYRQVAKEKSGNQRVELKHILVIEEAHRLLKNIDTERSTETSGNPKGKAVEHFTNMIAEMRSYGQGVIVAEQIPTKLAPDVIKNSSTKIVQRIVSIDDQQVIANTIGISTDDALQLGTLEAGYALCHKEGMSLPSSIKITNNFIDDGITKNLDVFVSDEQLYNRNNERFFNVNFSKIRNALGNDDNVKRKLLAFLNSLCTEKIDTFFVKAETEEVSVFTKLIKQLTDLVRQKNIKPILCQDTNDIIIEYIIEVLLSMIVRGVYCTNYLPEDKFIKALKNTLLLPTVDNIKNVKKHLSELYNINIELMSQQNVAMLINRSLKQNNKIDTYATIKEYFINISSDTIKSIDDMLDNKNNAVW